jgi:peptide chain release factor subunit 3
MSDEPKLQQLKDNREHINIVFIGHVDAGKSTISGRILIDTGKIDKRTVEKYEKEAKEKNRESWYLSYVTDLTEDERSKGKTQECSVASFETENKRITLLDAPGHSAYVPAMLTGAAQADVACLVISARKGEFEAGFESGGQTLEHIILARTMGISKILVMVNKMDEATVKWSQERYDNIVTKLGPQFKEFGYNLKKDITFFPASGFTGAGLKDRVKKHECDWYSGPSFFELLDKLPPIPRQTEDPVRLSVSAKQKDLGVFSVMGKLHAGVLNVGDELMCVPTMRKGTVTSITVDSMYETESAQPGENLTLKFKGLDEDDVSQGCILCPVAKPGHRTQMVECQIMLTGVSDTYPVLTNGATLVMHIHTATVECQLQLILKELSKKGEVVSEQPKFLRDGAVGIVRLKLKDVTALEKADEYPSLSRFTLRDRNKTLAIGRILRLKPQ